MARPQRRPRWIGGYTCKFRPSAARLISVRYARMTPRSSKRFIRSATAGAESLTLRPNAAKLRRALACSSSRSAQSVASISAFESNLIVAIMPPIDCNLHTSTFEVPFSTDYERNSIRG